MIFLIVPSRTFKEPALSNADRRFGGQIFIFGPEEFRD